MELAQLIATCAAAGMQIPHALQGLQLRVDTQAAAAAMTAPRPTPPKKHDPALVKQLQWVVDEGAGVLQGQARFLAQLRAQMAVHTS